jgi:hypothetical protein
LPRASRCRLVMEEVWRVAPDAAFFCSVMGCQEMS